MANYRNDFADVNLETGAICRNFMNHTIGSGDALGDRFGVRVFRNGEPVSLGGTCAGYFVRNTTGETVVISSGVVSGNEAYVTLPAACYAVEGSFTLAIKVTSGSETVTMRIIDGVVSRTNTSVTVDPGTLVPSIETLISAINSAVGQIPVNYNASFAPAYSTSSTYAVGDYVVYDGYLWRCTTAITEAETWTAAHWTKVALASDVSDLKSAFIGEQKRCDGFYVDSDATSNEIIACSTVLEVIVDGDPGETIKLTGIVNTQTNPYSVFVGKPSGHLYGGTVGSDGYNVATLPNGTKIKVKIDWDNFTVGINNTYAQSHVYITGNSLAQQANKNIKSRFNGRKISIIGDSIDTFNCNGYKIDGYNTYYPALGVDEVGKTWWKKVIDTTGAKLEVNASYAGSRATNTYQSYPDFYDRIGVIGSPDIIFVTLGTNDSTYNVALGEYDFDTAYTSLSESQFRPAYIKGVKGLQELYHSAQIVCIAQKMGDAYRDSIEYIAKQLSVDFIDASDYVGSSGVHPGVLGMEQIASLVLYPTDRNLWQKHFPADAEATGTKIKVIEKSAQDFAEETKSGEIILSSEIIDTYASGWSSVDKCTAIGKGKAANQPYVEASKAANFYKMKVNTGFDPSIESSPANLYFAFDYSADSSYVPFDCRKEYSFMVTNTNNSTKFQATIRLCDANKAKVSQFDVTLENNKRYTLTTDLTNVRYLKLYYFKGNTISVPFEITFSDFVCKTRFSTNLKTFYDGNTRLNKNSALSRFVGGRQIGSFPVSSNSYYSGLCMVHGDIFQFLTSDDEHVNYVKGAVFGITIESGDIYYKETFTDNFGHMNTVSYCEATDSLIFGNGSGDNDLPCKFYVYQGFYAAYANGTRQFSISDCVEYDCSNITEFSGEIKMNAIWGDDDLLKYDQAILITNDNGTIRIVQLGKGTNQLSKGSYTASADGVFNGTFEIIKTYTQDVGVIPTESVNVCIQDAEYRDGVIYAGIGHNHFEMWKMTLNDVDNSIVTEKVLKHFRNANGTTTTDGGIAGIEVTDEYLILLLSPDYYYVYKL